MTANKETIFMDKVQEHERNWGVDKYRGRPSLHQILTANVVAFWRVKGQAREVITLHDDLSAIERHLLLQLVSNEESKRKLVSVFQEHTRMKIKSVNIEFIPSE